MAAVSGQALPFDSPSIPWISVAQDAPYFVEEGGGCWTPIGQNDAISWPDLQGLFLRRDLPSAEAYLADIAAQGVTCIRLMLEYSQTKHRYFERPAGKFNPRMIQLWDDLVALCRKHRLRILLTPYDTFWMWLRWKDHPYNVANGGPCQDRRQWLLCPLMRELVKRRLEFATERWGGDGTIFAWDLWNEIHPSHASDSADPLFEFLEEISRHLREFERRVHGFSHLQTVSIFHPALALDAHLENLVYRNPCLDFANIHLYEHGTIDHPRNTVDAAIGTGKLIAAAVKAAEGRPVFDSEHGPIHTFKDHHRSLEESFDDEYFRHIQWAHLASGGAGGGMRWPNRRPHCLTPGMRKEQQKLASFMPLIDWATFRRVPRNGDLGVDKKQIAGFACSDSTQAVVYLLRRDTIQRNGKLNPSARPICPKVRVPGLRPGAYRITPFDPVSGAVGEPILLPHFGSHDFEFAAPPFVQDLVLAIRHT
jgi:hypothetical protein